MKITLNNVLLGLLIILLIAVVVILIVKCINNNKSKFYKIENKLEPIPKVIHKVYIQNSGEMAKFPLEPKELQEAHDSWKKMNPEYEIKYYSMNDCREYLKKHFEDSDFLQAFDCFNAYAFKCDFFRYCVLYNEGGWYSDWKQVCLKQNLLNELDNNKKYNIIFCWDKGNIVANTQGWIQNCFIGVTKYNLFLKECINEIINNIKNNFYGYCSLDCTSPSFLGRMYKKSEFSNFKIYLKFYNLKIYSNEKLIINHKCNNCGINQDWDNGNNYNVIWNENNMYKKFKIKDYIPKIIHKTGPFKINEIPVEINNILNIIKLNNPDYKLKYYSDDECYQIIKNNFSSDVLWAYNKLKPSAYKADLFRYCILYLYGGIYSDLTQNFLVPINNLIDFDKDTLILVNNDNSFTDYYYYMGIQISFIMTIPKQKIFKLCIDKIINNCKNKFYGKTNLEITGPYCFKNILNETNVNYNIKFNYNNSYISDFKNKNIITTRIENHYKILYKNNIHYSILWKNRYVYNPDICSFKHQILTDKQLNNLSMLLSAFLNFTNNNNIPFFAVGGTLIGCIRDGGFMFHDDDIDFGLIYDEESINKIENYKNTEFYFQKVDFGYKFWINDLSDVWIDLFVYVKKKNVYKILGDEFQNEYFNYNEVFPLLIKNFGKYKINVPNKYDKFLNRVYNKYYDNISLGCPHNKNLQCVSKKLKLPELIQKSYDNYKYNCYIDI